MLPPLFSQPLDRMPLPQWVIPQASHDSPMQGQQAPVTLNEPYKGRKEVVTKNSKLK